MNRIVRVPLSALLMAAALLAAPAAAPADVLTLNDGRELFGDLVRLDAEGALLRTATGEIAIPAGDLLDAGLLRSYGVAGESTPAEVRDPRIAAALASPPAEAEYPNAAAVVLLDEGILAVAPDGSTVYTERIISSILKERGRDEANTIREYDPELETVTILHARAITPSGIFPADDRAVADESSHGAVPGYERERSLKCAIPESNPGAILDRAFRTARKPSPPDRPFRLVFQFGGAEPVRLARFVFRRPAGSAFDWRVRTGECALERTDTVEPDGTLVTTLEARDIPPTPGESFVPPDARAMPRVVVATATDPQALTAFYAAELARLRAELPGAAAAASAFAGGTPAGRTGAVALHDAFVRDILLAPVPMEHYSLLPSRPAERLARKMANALDKTFLYYALARAAGLPVSFCLVRTHGEGPLSEEPFSLAAFDAACLRLDLPDADGGPVWFAPLYENHRFGVLPEGWQGADALPLDGSGDVVVLPVDDARASGLDRVLTATLGADGNLAVRAVETWRGLYDAALRPLKQSSDEERLKWAEKRLADAHPKATLLEFAIDGLDDLSRDITVTTVYRVDDFAVAAGPYRLFRMPGLSRGAFAVGDPVRKRDLYWGAPEAETTRVAIRLPDGLALRHLPPPSATFRPGYAHVAGCGYSAGALLFTDRLERTALLAPRAEYPRYKAFVEAAAAFLREWTVLEAR